MIRWCSYCQSFMGETAPLDDFSWTDGICLTCKSKDTLSAATFTADFKKKLQFFRSLREKAITGQALDLKEVIGQARETGAGPADVMMGILQPILCELGKLFNEGKTSTIEEHRFSAFTDRVLDQFETEFAPALDSSGSDEVILANADGNYHTIGIRMLSLVLQMEGIRSRSITPSVPAADLIQLCRKTSPAVLGISLFAEEQVTYVHEVFRCLGPDRPELIAVGGSLFKQNPVPLHPSIYVADPKSIDKVVNRIKAACHAGKRAQPV